MFGFGEGFRGQSRRAEGFLLPSALGLLNFLALLCWALTQHEAAMGLWETALQGFADEHTRLQKEADRISLEIAEGLDERGLLGKLPVSREWKVRAIYEGEAEGITGLRVRDWKGLDLAVIWPKERFWLLTRGDSFRLLALRPPRAGKTAWRCQIWEEQ